MMREERERSRAIHMKGQLSEHPLAELIREISAARLTGALRLVRERVKAVVYFNEGAATGARSNMRLHRLSECLRRWGVLAEEHQGLLAESMSDEEVVQALSTARVLDAEEFPALQARQGAEVLRLLLLWTDGEWSFDPRARINESARVAIEIGPLLLESARRLPPEFVASRMANEAETLARATDSDEGVALLPVEGFVLSRLDAPLGLGELVMLTGLPEADARQAVYTLALAGLVRRERWPPAGLQVAAKQAEAEPVAPVKKKAEETPPPVVETPKEEVKPTPQPEPDPLAEIDALLAHAAGETHYQVLGITRTARQSDIKTTYYALAKRFHPDRFRRHAEGPVRVRIDNAFAKIAQAYDVLKDTKQRAAYDLKLDTDARRAAKQKAQAEIFSAPKEDGPSPQFRAEESFQQGLSALQTGNRLMAVMYFGEAARLMPRQARYRALYGRALAGDASTRRQAEAELKAAIALDTNNASYHVMLAEIYRDLGMRLRAESELQRALAVDAQHVEARRLLDALRNEPSKV
jgi:tetratricopeptide (TPR) repeat protein